MSMSFVRPPSLLAIALAASVLLAPAAVAGEAPAARSSQATAPSWTLANQPCWDAAGARHGVDPWLLYATAYVESNYDPSAIGNNRNGTRDLGLMQINSSWLPTLHKWGVPEGAWRNACASTYIGAWIMAANFRRYGYTWQAIAAYNVGTVDDGRRGRIGLAYARKVYRAYAGLASQRLAGPPRAGLPAPSPALPAAAPATSQASTGLASR